MAPTRPSPSASSSTSAHRYERKYSAGPASVREVELRVKLHPGLFREAYPPRYVNNVYLDSPGMTSLHTHINGAAERTKHRIRWYGERRGTVERPVLEQKGKRGMVNFKRSDRLPAFEFDGRLRSSAWVEEWKRAGADSAVVDGVACRAPVLFNRYRRQYFETSDHRVRLTIDSELWFESLDDRPHPLRTYFQEDGLVIVELKYDDADEPLGQLAASAFPFRLERMSKYVRGLHRLAGSTE